MNNSYLGNQPRVAVILVSRNCLDDLRQTLHAIVLETAYPSYEIIVVDDASTDGSREWLRGQERIAVVDITEPVGYSNALSLSLHHVTPGADVAVLRTGASLLSSGWLSRLVALAYEREDAGVIEWVPIASNGDDKSQPRVSRLVVREPTKHGDTGAPANYCAGLADAIYLRSDSGATASNRFPTNLVVLDDTYPEKGAFWGLPNEPGRPGTSYLGGEHRHPRSPYHLALTLATRKLRNKVRTLTGRRPVNNPAPRKVVPELLHPPPGSGGYSEDGYWGTRARELAEDGGRGWLDDQWILDNYVFPKVFGQGYSGSWGKAIVDRFDIPLGGRWLSIGCGGGNAEISYARQGLFAEMDAYDYAADAIKVAIEQAAAQGIDNIHFGTFNGNIDDLPAESYDVVHMNMSLHHIMRLERLVYQLRRAVKESGWLVVNEYIGPSQFQYSNKQVQVVRDLLDRLPPRLRYNAVAGYEKRQYPIFSRSYWQEFDPTEACRSEDIPAVISRAFPGVIRRDYNGAILNLLLENLVTNFDKEREEDLSILRMLLAIEDYLTATGAVASQFALFVAQKRKDFLADVTSALAAWLEPRYYVTKILRDRGLG
jgi:ubiquinone/menaquinone biosynthesis C-methylase UbiE